MPTDYAQIIFGGISEVKRLIVLDIKMKREALGLTTEYLDKIFGLNADWPRFCEIEADPQILTNSYLQEANDGTTKRLFDLSSDYKDYEHTFFSWKSVNDKIHEYLEKTPGAIEKAAKEFQETSIRPRVTVWPKDLGEQARKIHAGEPVSWGSLNSVTPQQWADIHIFLSIMKQLG